MVYQASRRELFSLDGAGVNGVTLSFRDRPAAHQSFGEVVDAADKLSVILRVATNLLYQVGERAAVVEEDVRHARIATGEAHRRRQVGVRVAVRSVGRAVEVCIREPAHVPHQFQRQVVGRFEVMGQIAVDGRFHQQAAEGDGIVVRTGRTGLHGIRHKEPRPAESVGTGADVGVFADGGGDVREIRHHAEAVGAPDKHTRNGDARIDAGHAAGSGRRVGRVVVDNNRDGPGVLRGLGFDHEAASPAFDQSDLAGDGGGIRQRRAAVRRGRPGGIRRVNRRHHAPDDGRVERVDGCAEGRRSELVSSGDGGRRQGSHLGAA